ncbi:bleomycin resistance protein [Macrococcus sp. EM39E]|uniref:bleomycin resistance protein n=1 Tax=Macrococcus animalis TaxID=3395467 RepID=UPI0039BE6FB3
MIFNALIPEFEVSNIDASIRFYIDILEFILEYERPEDKFVFLSKEGSQLMLEQTTDNTLEYPFGRGFNLSFTVKDVEYLYSKLLNEQYPIYRSLETRTFRVGNKVTTPKEFAINDPDGYLLRFQN